VLEIDGAYGEGGGQLVRTAAALAAITGRAIRVRSVRARRDKPGLAPQHLAALRAVAALSAARTAGLELRSEAVELAPGGIAGGRHRFDVGTAGSVSLVMQALLPVMIAGGTPCTATIAGGTDVRAAPPLDYFGEVLLPLVRRIGADARLTVLRRGYYPRGGGEVELAVAPAKGIRPLELDQPGTLDRVAGIAHVGNLPAHIAARMRSSALGRLEPAVSEHAEIETRVLGAEEANGPGGAIVAWASTEHTILGAGRVAERGVPAEALGEAVGAELAADLASGATLDVHAADQMLIYLALARGGAFATRELTSHAHTAIWLIEQFLPVRFEISAAGPLTRVAVVPR
jgi:RNA 3'-terminal phosphate cyclase (ATP)